MIKNMKEMILDLDLSETKHEEVRVSIKILYWVLAVSDHSHQTGYHVLGAYSQQVRRMSDRSALGGSKTCALVTTRNGGNWNDEFAPLHPDQGCRIATLQGFQRIGKVIGQGL